MGPIAEAATYMRRTSAVNRLFPFRFQSLRGQQAVSLDPDSLGFFRAGLVEDAGDGRRYLFNRGHAVDFGQLALSLVDFD